MTDNGVPPPNGNEPPLWAAGFARREEKLFPDEDALRGQKVKNDVLWLKVYGFVVVVMMIVFVLLFLVSLVSWAWHYTMPICWHWLTPEQISKIQSVIFSGSLGGIVSVVAQRQLAK